MKNKLFALSLMTVILMMSVLSMIPLVHASTVTISRQVSTSADDCFKKYYISTGEQQFYLDRNYVIAGMGGTSSTGGIREYSGMRFQSISVPQGAYIMSTKIEFYANIDWTQGGDIQTAFYGEDTDDASTFSTLSNFNNRPRTSAKVDWDYLDGLGKWYKDQKYVSPELKTIVQEIVDRPNWQSGNDIVIFWGDDGTTFVPTALNKKRGAYSYDGSMYYFGNNAKAPKLEITYMIFPFTHDKDLNVNHETIGTPRTYPRGTTLPSGQWYTNINFNPDPSNYAKVGVSGYAYLRAYSYATFIPPICEGWSNAFFEQGRAPYCAVQLGKFKAGATEESAVDTTGIEYDCFYYEPTNEHKLEIGVKITKRYVNQPFAFASILVALLFQYRWADGSLSEYDEPAKTNEYQSVHYDVFLSRAWRKAGVYGEDSVGTQGWQWGDAYNNDLHVQYVVGQMDVGQWYTFTLDYGQLLNKCKDIMWDAWDGRGGLPSGTHIILKDIQISCEVIGSEMEVTVDYVRFVRV